MPPQTACGVRRKPLLVAVFKNPPLCFNELQTETATRSGFGLSATSSEAIAGRSTCVRRTVLFRLTRKVAGRVIVEKAPISKEKAEVEKKTFRGRASVAGGHAA